MKHRFSQNLTPQLQRHNRPEEAQGTEDRPNRGRDWIYSLFVFGVSIMLGLLCLTNNQYAQRFRNAVRQQFGFTPAAVFPNQMTPAGNSVGDASSVASLPIPREAHQLPTTIKEQRKQLQQWLKEANPLLQTTLHSSDGVMATQRAEVYRTQAAWLRRWPHLVSDEPFSKWTLALQHWLEAAAALEDDLSARLQDRPHRKGDWWEAQRELRTRWEDWQRLSSLAR